MSIMERVDNEPLMTPIGPTSFPELTTVGVDKAQNLLGELVFKDYDLK